MNAPKLTSATSRFLKPFLLSLGLFGALHPSLAQTTVVMTPVAEEGDSAPGTAGVWDELSLSYAAVGIDGGVAFTGTVGGVQGAWFGNPGSLELVELVGQPAPGTGSNFNNFTNNFGITPVDGFGIAFHNRLADTNMSFWTASTGPVLNLLALEGAAAPGATANFTTLSEPSINNDGNTVFRAQLDAGGTRTLWFSPAAGPPVYIARNTEPMSAIAGANYNVFGANYSVSDTNLVSFTCSLLGTTTDQVLLSYAAPAGPPVLVAREGNAAPGPGTTEPFATFPDCHINDSGDIIFDATLAGAAPAHRNSGVWLYDSGTSSVSEVAVEGDAVPGVAGAFFHDFQELFLANNGVLAIVARARDTADNTGSTTYRRGVWIDAGGGLELVALVGEDTFEKDGVTVFGPVTTINQVSMSMDGDLALEMNNGGTKGVWIHEATVGAATRLQIAVGDKTYDGNRQVRSITGIDLPEAEVFTPSGGGPLGRARALRNDSVPLVHVNMDSGAHQGLYFAERQSLNFLITSSNEEAPGTPVGTEFESIRPSASMGENGLIALRGYLRVGTGGTVLADSQGMWAEELVGSVPQLTLVARTGDATPGGDTYGQLPVNPIFNSSGEIAFNADLDGGGAAVFAGPIGGLTEVAKRGLDVNISGITPGAVYDFVRSAFAYNDDGYLVSSCTLMRDSDLGITINNDSAILLHGPAPRLIARENASVGTGGVGVFDHLLNRPVRINTAERVAFLANRKRNPAFGITADNATVVCYRNSTSLTCVAAGGAATSTAGVQFLKPTDLTFNDANRIGFRTTLQGTGVTAGVNDVALYFSNAGVTPVLLVRTGTTQASGTGPAGVDPDATFAAIGRPDSDATNTLVFRATLTVGQGGVTADDAEGIWTNAGAGTTALLLREGAAAPDASGVASAAVFESFDDPVISLDGRVVVGATLRVGVGGITTDTDRAVFVSDSAGVFYRVVQKGQLMDIAVAASLGGGTSSEAIVEVGYPSSGGGAGGFYKAINSEGFVLTYLTFEDGETASMVFLVP